MDANKIIKTIKKEIYKSQEKNAVFIPKFIRVFKGGIQLKIAENKALKIIPDLVDMVENGKLTEKYIQDNLLDLYYLIELYDTEELELLIEKQKLNKQLENF